MMENYCGSTFWNSSVTWYTDNPDFTVCFEKTVLLWIPCIFLWIFSFLEGFYMSHSVNRNVPRNWLNISKDLVTLLLCLNMLIDFIYNIYNRNSEFVETVDICSPFIKLICFIYVGSLAYYNRQYGIRTSGLLFLFWLLLGLFGAPQFRTEIRSAQMGTLISHYNNYSYLIHYPLVVLMFLLNCLAEEPPTITKHKITQNPCPEEGASFLSRLFFAWYDKLAWKGFRNPLEKKDLWDLQPVDSSAEILSDFEHYWNKTIKKYNKHKAQFSGTEQQVSFSADKKKEASVLPALLCCFGPSFIFGALLKLVQDLLTFISPQILGLIISFVKDRVGQYYWHGVFYAVLLFATASLQTLFLAQYFNRMFIIGMRIRTALISTIYKKSLNISNKARKDRTAGEIVNLMAVDAQKFIDLTAYLNMIWSAPLQIGLSMYFLWKELGPSVLAGLAVMIILIPVNIFVANKSKILQIKQMKNKDERVKLMNELLSGIKVLKLYAWEPSFEQQVLKIRDKEIKVLKKAAYLNAGTSFIWSCAPFLVALATFASFILSDKENILTAEITFKSLSLFSIMSMPMGLLPLLVVYSIEVALVSFATYVLVDEKNVLDASKAFVSISLFNILRFPLSMLPNLITNMVQALVSVKRINAFLSADELDPNNVAHEKNEDTPVIIENGNFSWDEESVLKNINIKIQHKTLTAIVGPVGSGKSSLISAFIGEMEKTSGKVNTYGKVAYVAQQAWIQNATLKDNILFGKSYDKDLYDRVVEACALKPDFDILPGGDETEIGEKGINLSGGQKQRVSLARAVYANAEIYYLDDPLSAVDAHVGKHIFDKVIGPNGLLKNKTRVLVTHGITFLPQTDMIIVLDHGEIGESGNYTELMNNRGAFAIFLLQHIQEDEEDEEVQHLNRNSTTEIDGELEKIKSQITNVLPQEVVKEIVRMRSRVSESKSNSDSNPALNGSLQRQKSQDSNKSARKESTKGPVLGEKLIEVEKSETGQVSWQVYKHYLLSIGLVIVLITILLNMLFQASSIGSNVWLGIWVNDTSVNGDNGSSVDTGKRNLYLEIYGVFGIAQVAVIFLAVLSLCIGTLNAAKKLHLNLLSNILRSSCPDFFDVTPLGRILNRFSMDIDTLDIAFPMTLRAWINCFFSVIGTIVVTSYTTPPFLIVAIPLGLVYYFIQRFYVATSRQLKRLESVSRSPIFSHFGETISGVQAIRAFGQKGQFIKESEKRVDENQICYYPSLISNRWLAVRLEMIANSIILFAALFAVLSADSKTASLVGLSITYCLQITQTLNWLVRMTSDVETNIVAVERIKEYTEVPREAPWELPNTIIPSSWPETGSVEFKDYSVRYRPGLDLVLHRVNFTVKGGEKVGIVGRTGAGKSSLTLALFRIIEAAEGEIIIDGVNIANLGLHTLRSRLTIIPQDAVLFSGSLRMNLDPFDKHGDEELWNSLELAHLKEFVKGLPSGLNHEITEGGDNLSVGQRQLVCLARALLRKTKILILDEATAAVDLETDDLIQKTIRSEFKECTVLTIAHRLNTIMDSDRVIVLDKGKIVEFDSPEQLLLNRDSIFYGMCKDAGLA